MGSGSAYDSVARLALDWMASSGDAEVAGIARDMLGHAPAPVDAHGQRGVSKSERLLRLRELACASRLDKVLFDAEVSGLEECAEKRFLMAVASVRGAYGGSVSSEVAKDLAAALAADPGNAEYLAFASSVLGRLDSAARNQILDEENLISVFKAMGHGEKGTWRYV